LKLIKLKVWKIIEKSKKPKIKKVENLSFFRFFGGLCIAHVSLSIQLLNIYYFAFNLIENNYRMLIRAEGLEI
jgi:hypothetical protein